MTSSNRISLAYVEETTYNTTPVNSANWETVRLAGADGLTSSTNTVRSNQVRADRNRDKQLLVGRQTGGSIPGEFSADTWDTFLEAALQSTFTAGELVNAITPKSFTFQRHYEELTNKYRAYSGCRINGFTLDWSFGQIATINFDIVGASVSTPTSSLVGTGTLAPATTTKAMAALDVSNILIDGNAAAFCFQNFSVTVTNNSRAKNCAADVDPVDQLTGSFDVTTSFSGYLEDSSFAFIARKDNQTPFSMSYQISDGTTTYTVETPIVQAGGDDPSGQGLDSDAFITLTGSASFDQTINGTMRITKA